MKTDETAEEADRATSAMWFSGAVCNRINAFVNERSAGFAALILASLLTVGWLRSQIFVDELVAEARSGRVFEVSYLYRSSEDSIRFIRREWSMDAVQEFELLSVHYAAITLPLAALSAVLILRPVKRAETIGISEWM